MEEINSRKRPLKLDWNEIFDQNDGEPPQIEIVKGASEPPRPSPMTTDQSREDIVSLTDHELKQNIKRQKDNFRRLSPTLPDGGEKIRNVLKLLEEEDQRRELARAEKDADPCLNHIQLTSADRTDGCERENAFSKVNSRSEFASCFTKKIEGNKNHSVDNAYDKEISILGRRRDQQKMRSRGAMFENRTTKNQLSSSRFPFPCDTSLSQNGGKRGTSSHQNGESLSSNLMRKKDNCQAVHSNGSRPRKGQTIVLEDEDDTQFVKTERENRIGQCDSFVAFSIKDTKIYYPSRDDPELVEICFSNINCLDPEGFLTSEIMNFYIRYLRLQMSPTNNGLCDYHFFNTFFYKKLKQAVSHKGSDKESSFIKFRRWWKGVNIFQKAYVFIPIHEDLHWSLVIICIPDREDNSGPIILHLDSLGFHSSKSVFEEIRSYLKQEWHYLKEEVSPPDLPISVHIWENLPRRIDEKKIEVPQQKNDSDCGLFVLFFMERFIEVAPERLKKKDLAMFSKRWFRPQEASDLRVKIRNLLLDEFEKETTVNCSLESPSSPTDGAPP
ncbi:ubiquitin-like-specific protease 1D isoform X2 [Euphorbia lathyris]|uniref:ubiquitin-like-specific protease 1D isoform X2 n=1 Tax=Euphorbia lathyris TaxID=212925 RepID=UPI003313D894